MKIRKRNKDKMRYAPMYLGKIATGRKDGVYYEDYCCKECFWDWGVGFSGKRFRYKHEYTESNNKGILKKYWKSSYIDHFAELENENE